MALPAQPVSLTVEQIDELNKKLGTMRHDIGGNLQLILSAGDLMRLKPEMTDQLMTTVLDQPEQITKKMAEFSRAFEQALGITRP